MNDNDFNRIACKCCKIFNKNNFPNHFKYCEDFKNEFKDFDLKLSLLLKQYIDIDNLILIKHLFKEYLKLINHKIKEFEEEIRIKQQIEFNGLMVKEEETPSKIINRREEKNIKNNINKNINFWDSIAPTNLHIFINNNEIKSTNNGEQINDENHIDDNQGFFRTTNNIKEKNQELIYSKPQLFDKKKEEIFEKPKDDEKLENVYEIKTGGFRNIKNKIEKFEIEILANEREVNIAQKIDEDILLAEGKGTRKNKVEYVYQVIAPRFRKIENNIEKFEIVILAIEKGANIEEHIDEIIILAEENKDLKIKVEYVYEITAPHFRKIEDNVEKFEIEILAKEREVTIAQNVDENILLTEEKKDMKNKVEYVYEKTPPLFRKMEKNVDKFEIEILAEKREISISQHIDEIILLAKEKKENEVEPVNKIKTVGESVNEIKTFVKNKEKNMAEHIFEMTISAKKKCHNIEKSEESLDK